MFLPKSTCCMQQREPILFLCKYYEFRKGLKVSDFDEESLIQFWSDLFETERKSEAARIEDPEARWPFLSGDSSLPTENEKEKLQRMRREDLVRAIYSFFEWKRSALSGKPLFTENELVLTSKRLTIPKTPRTPRVVPDGLQRLIRSNLSPRKTTPAPIPMQRKGFIPTRLIYSADMSLSVKKGKYSLIQMHHKRRDLEACMRLFSEHFKWLEEPSIVPGLPANFSNQVRDTYSTIKTEMKKRKMASVRSVAPHATTGAEENKAPIIKVDEPPKTTVRRMCFKWLEFGTCNGESTCAFAHSLNERFSD